MSLVGKKEWSKLTLNEKVFEAKILLNSNPYNIPKECEEMDLDNKDLAITTYSCTYQMKESWFGTSITYYIIEKTVTTGPGLNMYTDYNEYSGYIDNYHVFENPTKISSSWKPCLIM